MTLLPTPPACLRFELWPEGDRAAWLLGCAPDDTLDDLYGSGLRPASLQKARKGYGRWLHFLGSRGWLDLDLPPLVSAGHRSPASGIPPYVTGMRQQECDGDRSLR